MGCSAPACDAVDCVESLAWQDGTSEPVDMSSSNVEL